MVTESGEATDRRAWERPGAFEVVEGVYRIPLPLPGDALKAVNVYAIVDGDRLVLIDGGWATTESTETLTRGLESIGFALGDVREFLVTHIHRDHYTHAVTVRRLTGAIIGLGELERESLEAVHHRPEDPIVASLYAGGAPELARAYGDRMVGQDLSDWESPDTWLRDNVELPLQTRTLRVISTPGHTYGHVVFHDPAANVLFAGDHVLPHITPSIGFESIRRPSPLRDYLSSLQLVRELPDATLLPAHGPVGPSLHARVDELLVHHERRLAQTLTAVQAGASTGYEAASALAWTRRDTAFSEMDTLNQSLAVRETVAHLWVLENRGQVRYVGEDGVLHFQPA